MTEPSLPWRPRPYSDLLGGGPPTEPDVPVAVWRLDTRADESPFAEPNDAFAARLARQLLYVYTGTGDTVVDLDADPHVESAAAQTDRQYRWDTDRGSLANPRGRQPVELVVLRWPRRHVATDEALVDLFAACRSTVSQTGSTIVAIRPTPGRPAARARAAAWRRLNAVANAAGLRCATVIIAVGAPENGEFLYYATSLDDIPADDGPRADLLVFGADAEADIGPVPAG